VLIDLDLPNWHNLPIEDWFDLIGCSVVVPVVRDKFHLIILQFDYGTNQHDPCLSVLVKALIHLVELKDNLMRQLGLTLKPATDEASLCALNGTLNAACEVSSLARRVEEARAKLKEVAFAHCSLRQLSAEDRVVEEEAAALVEESEGCVLLVDVKDQAMEARRSSRRLKMSATVQRCARLSAFFSPLSLPSTY
jgi:hypothetical protein